MQLPMSLAGKVVNKEFDFDQGTMNINNWQLKTQPTKRKRPFCVRVIILPRHQLLYQNH